MNVADLLRLLEWKDAVDIFAVAAIVYILLKLIRGTRAAQMLLGIFVVLAVWYVAQLFDLSALQRVLQGFLFILPFAIIVLFQQPIRRALAGLGRNTLFGFGDHEKTETSFNEIVLAANALSNRRIGALLVIERGEGLRDYIENGIALDSEISSDLLLSIFQTSAPLHDGAAIVQGDRLAAAACFLPLTSNPELSTKFGTRHRAALGISEESDALAVVVSEENSMISVALGGELIEDLDARSLRNTLYRYLIEHDSAGDQL